MPPCLWMVSMNLPCPTCGMTTAFAHAADGRFFMAFRAQPAGAMLALLTGMLMIGSFWVAATGRRVDLVVGPLLRPRTFLFLGVVVLGGWLYKIAAVRGWL